MKFLATHSRGFRAILLSNSIALHSPGILCAWAFFARRASNETKTNWSTCIVGVGVDPWPLRMGTQMELPSALRRLRLLLVVFTVKAAVFAGDAVSVLLAGIVVVVVLSMSPRHLEARCSGISKGWDCCCCSFDFSVLCWVLNARHHRWDPRSAHTPMPLFP